jgi:SP family myo-inositol transporter-like MFS transporter 13
LYFKDDWSDITTLQRELIVSLALLGAFFGALIAGPLSDKFGRRPILILADLLFALGAAIMAFAENIPTVMAGRVILGLAIGTSSMVEPVYLSEVSPVKVRGMIVAVYIVSVTTG